jgi:hypothetical protein
MGPRNENEDYTTEYAKFALNSRGVPEDFETWAFDLGGRANREASNKKKSKRPPKMREE